MGGMYLLTVIKTVRFTFTVALGSGNCFKTTPLFAVSVKTESVTTEEVSLDFSVNGVFQPLQELNFSAEKPENSVEALVNLYKHVDGISNAYWKEEKQKETNA